MEGTRTAIQVTAKFFPLAFLLYATKPTVTVDGTPSVASWGTNSYDVSSGRHTVKVAFRYLWMKECGANSIEVDVPEGKTTKVRFYMPPWMLAKGSLKEEAA
jgi:hypothetical protein